MKPETAKEIRELDSHIGFLFNPGDARKLREAVKTQLRKKGN